MAETLGDISDNAIWRVMRKHNLHLDRHQSWCVSTDTELSHKTSEIVGLYLKPPENAIILSVDKKPNIQTLERAQNYIHLPNNQAISNFTHKYKKHNTTTLFATLETTTKLIKINHYKHQQHQEFLNIINNIIKTYKKKKEIHIILNNLNTHKPKNNTNSKAIPTYIYTLHHSHFLA